MALVFAIIGFAGWGATALLWHDDRKAWKGKVRRRNMEIDRLDGRCQWLERSVAGLQGALDGKDRTIKELRDERERGQVVERRL